MISHAQGFPGHMFSETKDSRGNKFYNYVRESSWLQEPGILPSEYSDLHESFSYWFNDLVTLAYSLQDSSLKAQVHQAAQTVLDLQTDDGWIGPEDHPNQERVFWGRYPFFLGLIQLAEANSTWTDPVDSLRRFMDLANQILHAGGKGYRICEVGAYCTCGQVRVADFMITIQWLLQNHLSESQDEALWDTMNPLQDQNQYNWRNDIPMVLINQLFRILQWTSGLKSPAVLRRSTRNDSLLQTAASAVSLTTLDHGSPSGSILGDEILRDQKPSMRSELCTAVETGYSLAYFYQATGDNTYADHAELVYYNALPAKRHTAAGVISI
ncbi:hypothetical protein F5Y19DRAFT_475731 [Xylariaceae sp. FL1651]|nr:hypothetical protein F5Y19DRAFT_475731 [Xylariaceae sp. FL1651]